MNKGTMGILRGIGAGILAGVAVSMMSRQRIKPSRRVRRGANKALRVVANTIDEVGEMMR